MGAALLGLFRMAIPFAATLFGGYFLSDVFNEKMKAKQAQQKAEYPALIGRTLKQNPEKWKFLAIGGLAVGALVAFLTKKLK